MKLPRAAVVTAASVVLNVCVFPFQQTQAWTTTTTNTFSSSSLYHRPAAAMQMQRQFLSTSSSPSISRTRTSSILKASVLAEGETDLDAQSKSTTPPTVDEGMLMAKGSVVSFFRGGLTAVRIDEDNFDDTNNDAPNVLSPTDVPSVAQKNKKFTSDLGGDLVGHQVIFSEGQTGVVVAHRAPIAFVYSGLETFDGQNGPVSILKEMTKMPIQDDMKVVQWNGKPAAAAALAADGDCTSSSSDGAAVTERAIFAPIPQVKDIALINNPMLTGSTMVDVLAPIGRGQNMLLIADDLAAARGMICDFISTQKRMSAAGMAAAGGKTTTKKGTKFVYAAIENSDDAMERLRASGLADDVHVVLCASSTNQDVEEAAKAAEATAVAASACAIAESYAVEQGMNTVVIVDTLDQHKTLWDATTRVLVDVFGIESVVKSDREGGASSEMRGFFSSIIQRSAQYKVKGGGGSVTLLLLCALPTLQGGDEDTIYSESDFEGTGEKVRARIQLLMKKGIPLTAANLRKIEIPIPSDAEGHRRLVLQHIDDLMSMSDGQIWLDEKLRAAGQYPPIDPRKSVTRIGIGADTESRADAPALRRIAEGLRLALSQAADVDGAEISNASKKQVRTGKALLLAMHQEEGSGGRTLSESCIALLAASNGLLDDAVGSGKLAGTEAGQKLVDDMINHVREAAPNAMSTIEQTLDLSEDAKKEVLGSIESFFSP